LVSLAPLKIKNGNVNFFEVTTPLIAMDLILNQLVTLLLTS